MSTINTDIVPANFYYHIFYSDVTFNASMGIWPSASESLGNSLSNFTELKKRIEFLKEGCDVSQVIFFPPICSLSFLFVSIV